MLQCWVHFSLHLVFIHLINVAAYQGAWYSYRLSNTRRLHIWHSSEHLTTRMQYEKNMLAR